MGDRFGWAHDTLTLDTIGFVSGYDVGAGDMLCGAMGGAESGYETWVRVRRSGRVDEYRPHHLEVVDISQIPPHALVGMVCNQ